MKELGRRVATALSIEIMRESVALTKEQRQKQMRTGLGARGNLQKYNDIFLLLIANSVHFSAFPTSRKKFF
jgi:hypothetical protein